MLWIIVAVIAIDAVLRLIVLKSDTRFDFRKSDTSNSNTLLVYLPGILADGVQSSLLMVPTWQQYGDVLLVSYDGKRFKPQSISQDVAEWIKNRKRYDKVVFIGSSLGGLLAYDTEARLTIGGVHDIDVDFLLLAAPTEWGDLKGPGKVSPLMYLWWAGPISNATTGKLFLKALFQKPKDDNIEDGVDRKELEQRVREAQSTPFSVYADQIRYVLGHGRPPEGSLIGIDAVFVSFERDEIVAEQAHRSWKPAFGGTLPLIKSDMTHVGYNEMPKASIRSFELAFAELDLKKG
ncbi:MAG: hypothetical protein V4678_03220 [Patescibacteria group bacterium]